ncbi:hypothetical protein Cpir12675_005311 [Ceratocystis pirilliformis]|uniref:Uncharacterized protein n=1 Tax=Ceratocystis pirilliformis TaxID=259994 RepID=A0ABR3YRS0_9PEZI
MKSTQEQLDAYSVAQLRECLCLSSSRFEEKSFPQGAYFSSDDSSRFATVRHLVLWLGALVVEPGVVLLEVAMSRARRQDSRDGASVQRFHPVHLEWLQESQRLSKVIGVWAVVPNPVLAIGPECVVLSAPRLR